MECGLRPVMKGKKERNKEGNKRRKRRREWTLGLDLVCGPLRFSKVVVSGLCVRFLPRFL